MGIAGIFNVSYLFVSNLIQVNETQYLIDWWMDWLIDITLDISETIVRNGLPYFIQQY